MALENVVKGIISGIEINDFTVYAKNVNRGRLRGEVRLNILIREGDNEEHLLNITVYYGLKPYYLPWVELFDINTGIKMKTVVEFFDSKIEDYLLTLFSKSLGPGEALYVEYYNDKETAIGLNYDIPPPVTRLGYKLFNLGFTWFKDWYFAEGGSEGGQKLQGEKPSNNVSKHKHLINIRNEVQTFLDELEKYNKNKAYVLNAQDRGIDLIRKFDVIASF